MTQTSGEVSERAGFRHSAAFYSGVDGLVDVVVPFVREGVRGGEPVLVAELPAHIDAIRAALGDDTDGVVFLDMAELGGNPARIIPAWHEFVSRNPGRAVRGVGEPAWPGRRAAELEECQLHEALLNVAFDDDDADFQLLCPYDRDGLSADVLDGATRTHPRVSPPGDVEAYGGHEHALARFTGHLEAPPSTAEEVTFDLHQLSSLRRRVHALGSHAGLSDEVVDDLVLAVHELATNSVEHAGGTGVVRGWVEPDCLVLEVSDRGTIDNLLVGRELAASVSETGRGVWMANQLCDLVQVRSSVEGTTVRLRSWL